MSRSRRQGLWGTGPNPGSNPDDESKQESTLDVESKTIGIGPEFHLSPILITLIPVKDRESPLFIE